jgi:mono/diheme cytochrome c family protein
MSADLNRSGGSRRCTLLARAGLLLCCLAVCGCSEQMMARQPAQSVLGESKFFKDKMLARPLVPGTVPHSKKKYDKHYSTGLNGNHNKFVQAAGVVAMGGKNPLGALALESAASPYVATFPVEITEKVLKRGKERYEIYCALCHGLTGHGDGMIPQRGFATPPSYHIERLKTAPPGYFFNVITRGYGAMPAHDYLVPPEDRWAITAYIRALQLSQGMPLQKLPKAVQEEFLKKAGEAK